MKTLTQEALSMHCYSGFALILIAAISPSLLSAPVPERKSAKPAIVQAGTEEWLSTLELRIPVWADVGVREDKKVAGMAIVRRQKNRDAWLQKNFRVERVKGKNLVRISFLDGNAEEQAAIINVVVDHYLKHVVGERRDSLTKSLKTARALLQKNRRNGKIKDEIATKGDESFKERENYIQKLPKLVEHAKAR